MKRTLALKKDTLTELGSEDLGLVVGGSAGTCYTCVPCLVKRVLDLRDALVSEPPPLPSIDTPCS